MINIAEVKIFNEVFNPKESKKSIGLVEVFSQIDLTAEIEKSDKEVKITKETNKEAEILREPNEENKSTKKKTKLLSILFGIVGCGLIASIIMLCCK